MTEYDENFEYLLPSAHMFVFFFNCFPEWCYYPIHLLLLLCWHTQHNNLGEEGFIWLTLPSHSPWVRKSGQKLNQEQAGMLLTGLLSFLPTSLSFLWQDLTIKPWLTSNSKISSCLCLPSAESQLAFPESTVFSLTMVYLFVKWVTII